MVRTFDAPEALNIRFYEVRAKSALNKVPKASRMPFRWTINPYRRMQPCMCLAAWAAIRGFFSADGPTRPLSDLRGGDAIYGTMRDGARRRFAITHVLATVVDRGQAGAYRRVRLHDAPSLSRALTTASLTRTGMEQVASEVPDARRPGRS